LKFLNIKNPNSYNKIKIYKTAIIIIFDPIRLLTVSQYFDTADDNCN